MVDSVLEDASIIPEKLRETPTRLESAGASNRGGRPNKPNEDSFYSSATGFYPGEIGSMETKIAENQERVSGLAKILTGLEVPDAKGVIETLQISPEDIEATHEAIQDLVQRKQLGGVDVVCDGVGSHGAGDIASSIATYIFLRDVVQNAQLGGLISQDVLKDAVLHAHNAVNAFNTATNRSSATTFVAEVTDKDENTFIVSVGDSRAYKVNEQGEAVRISRDHSDVEDDIYKEKPFFTPSRAHSAPLNNILNTVIGDRGKLESKEIRVYEERLQPGEALFLMSDGVWEGVQLSVEEAALIDQAFSEDCKTMDTEKALNKAHGKIFEKHLNALSLTNSAESLAQYLTRAEVGNQSGDHATAVVVKKPSDRNGAGSEVQVSQSPEASASAPDSSNADTLKQHAIGVGSAVTMNGESWFIKESYEGGDYKLVRRIDGVEGEEGLLKRRVTREQLADLIKESKK